VDILHVVVLMLENRSFDCMFGKLQAKIAGLDGLPDNASNIWHGPNGAIEIPAWNDPMLTSVSATIPDPDPGELYSDIAVQLRGLNGDAPMGGFVDNYMNQKPADLPYDPKAVMHYFTADQVPVLSQLACEFGVSDRWFASAPCQNLAQPVLCPHRNRCRQSEQRAAALPLHDADGVRPPDRETLRLAGVLSRYPTGGDPGDAVGRCTDPFPLLQCLCCGRGGRRTANLQLHRAAVFRQRRPEPDSQRHAPAAQHCLWRAACGGGLQRPPIGTAMEADAADDHVR